ncbi:hypothetical protein DID96_06425 [Burkholderia sp. Bp8963]|uniref:hypothetical protein n=1 Tax=Burkholderia sp. Bp8963 TaxID=2184547 RepID=UPI000F5B07C1|nr:hypothetical protein [Burkholderia sp. Bp8963]RQS74485.1 hypothetical protein DID96_06425 [Burkholderia sp. Bp8963]
MTSENGPDADSTRRPKSGWGPGKNAALSFAAFAVIFGVFTHVRREGGGEHANVAHVVSGAVATAPASTGKPAAVAAASPAVEPVANTAQAAPKAQTVSPAMVQVDPAATTGAGTQAAPATHARPAHSPSVTVAANAAHAANTHRALANAAVRKRYGDVHRPLQNHDFASARMRAEVASQQHPTVGRPVHTQTASVTHAEPDSARALARARSCAVLDEWGCVEQNASRVLAIDPGNSESRALLGQAIRNRL